MEEANVAARLSWTDQVKEDINITFTPIRLRKQCNNKHQSIFAYSSLIEVEEVNTNYSLILN